MHYTGLDLDRAGGRRTDAAWITGLAARPGTRVVPLWRDQCLVRGGAPVTLGTVEARALLDAAPEPVFLGMDGETAILAADLSGLPREEALTLAVADAVQDVRALVSTIGTAEAGLFAYARGITHWIREQRFCGACGGPTDGRDGGHVRVCRDCGKLLFPRIEPAVIVLVEGSGEPRRCLLGRHAGSAPEAFTTLAGFVEIGESLEDAVRREVFEEAGAVVEDVVYQGSQAWPFPAGLMVAFRAEAVSDETAADGEELVETRWFTPAELREHIEAGHGYRPDSIGKFLIESWIAENGNADENTTENTAPGGPER
ncbi:NAD(+) diphosphatase [Streptomyces sp. NPDC053755]|uniref:NAD(+) diphosphatase n=1 Tax=Streptomyces sp. NPDC053755 TaxID=3155815 RepID=UPI0034375BB1